jgi:hypothetical protein
MSRRNDFDSRRATNPSRRILQEEFLKEDVTGRTGWEWSDLQANRLFSVRWFVARERAAETERKMQISDVTCPECNAGYRRLQLSYQHATTGEYRCRCCDHLLEVFDGSACVAFRLTVQPEGASHAAGASVRDAPWSRRELALP